MGAEYDEVFFNMTFSPDSKRVAYQAQKGGKWLIVLDGQPGVEYDQIVDMRFSPDSKRVAYGVVQQGKKWLAVVDGQPSPEYDLVGLPTFSPDSKHVVYEAHKGKELVVVVDGQPVEYDRARLVAPIFRPDGVLEYLAVRGNSLYRVKCIPVP